MSSADQRGWGAGWPADRRKDMAKIVAGGISVLVHRAIAPIVAQLLDETAAGGYQLHPGECWGYANRAIRGSTKPSNHSWGLAVDLNAPANPMGDRLVTNMPAWMVDLWRRRGFAWGGDYQHRKDPMHFEFVGTPTDAAAMVAHLEAPATIAAGVPAVSPPAIHSTEFPQGDDMLTRHDVHIDALDAQGKGWVELDVAPANVISIMANGPYPPADGYWELPVFARQDRAGKTVVTITEGAPNAPLDLAVWVTG